MTPEQGTVEQGQDRPGMMPYGNTETAIRREVDVIAERFPDTDVAVIDAAVREVFAELRDKAEVETHVLALTRHRVYHRLEAQGHSFQPAAPPAIADESDVDPTD
jgi:hypothetical protein